MLRRLRLATLDPDQFTSGLPARRLSSRAQGSVCSLAVGVMTSVAQPAYIRGGHNPVLAAEVMPCTSRRPFFAP